MSARYVWYRGRHFGCSCSGTWVRGRIVAESRFWYLVDGFHGVKRVARFRCITGPRPFRR